MSSCGAGDNSLHPRWLKSPIGRSWDLIVNYYGDDKDKYRQDDVTRIDSKGPKWPALKALLETHKDLIARYDYVWLPDDDIDCSARDINRLFRLCRRYRLSLAQPALTPKSFFSHIVTIACPLMRLRYTNFVEIMVPCFERNFLMQCIPSMDASLSGWGLDYVWSKMAGSAPHRVAIIDAVSVTHTRRVLGGENYKALNEKKIDPMVELKNVLSTYNITDRQTRMDSIVTWPSVTIKADSKLARKLFYLGSRMQIAMAKRGKYPDERNLRHRLQGAYKK